MSKNLSSTGLSSTGTENLSCASCLSCDHFLMADDFVDCALDQWLLVREITPEGTNYLACDLHSDLTGPGDGEADI